jgi:hypothetical protein
VGNSVEKLCNGAAAPDFAGFLGGWSGFAQRSAAKQKILCNELIGRREAELPGYSTCLGGLSPKSVEQAVDKLGETACRPHLSKRAAG